MVIVEYRFGLFGFWGTTERGESVSCFKIFIPITKIHVFIS